MFEIKKVLGPLFSPLPVCLELLIVGVVLLWFTRQQRLGKAFVTMAGLLLALLSSEGFSGRLIHTLEAQYPPLNMSSIQTALTGGESDAIPWIVVLAGGATPNPTLPIQLQISHDSRVRMVEGIRLYHERKFSEASVQFNQVLQENPEDKAARIYLERSAHYMVKGVPEDWTGVEDLTIK